MSKGESADPSPCKRNRSIRDYVVRGRGSLQSGKAVVQCSAEGRLWTCLLFRTIHAPDDPGMLDPFMHNSFLHHGKLIIIVTRSLQATTHASLSMSLREPQVTLGTQHAVVR